MQDLTILGALKQLVFLRLNSPAKAIDLSFIEHYQQLTYLELHGKCKGMDAIRKCQDLETVILNCPVDCLEILTELPKLQFCPLIIVS